MYGPLSMLSNRIKEFEGLFGNGEEGYLPALDLREDANAYHVEIELPGLRQENIDVSFSEGELTVKGSRAWEKSEGTTWHRRERGAGAFERTVSFTVPVNGEKIDASFKDGVLTVTLPKAEEAKPRKVTVKVSDSK